jgi:EAL domain-containing protein (putative c-di-GMP-specific phosphodiesterase class I)
MVSLFDRVIQTSGDFRPVITLQNGPRRIGGAMDDLMLAIDDDPAFLDVVRITAEAAGFAIIVTTEAETFRAVLATRQPAVVLLDLHMPKSDGIELLHALADAGCRARIILTSGVDARVLGLAHRIGLDLSLQMAEPMRKPMRVMELRGLLASLRGRDFRPDAAALRTALADKQLELHYQPLVTLATRQPIGFEALVRWRHPEFGIVMPDRFVALAEREGLIDALTDQVLELAGAQIASWCRQGVALPVSVNVSATNIVAGLPDRLTQLCDRHDFPPNLLHLELTETAAMGNAALLLEVLTRVRLKGFQLAIDDFGTGFSSLVQLYRLPFSVLKIDQSFVRGMAHSDEAALIVGAIISLGQSLNLELIAEGIETEALLDRLVAMGCGSGQGYLFSRPMPPDQALAWVQAR